MRATVDRAGNSFLKSAEMQNKLGNKLDELNAFVEAANAYKQCSPKGEARHKKKAHVSGGQGRNQWSPG